MITPLFLNYYRKRFRVDNFIFFTLIFYEIENKKAAKFSLYRFILSEVVFLKRIQDGHNILSILLRSCLSESRYFF